MAPVGNCPAPMPPSIELRLLGPPRLFLDGKEASGPRGRKSWAVLARLALGGRPLARLELVDLLFADAVDPLGALRWTLSETRRCLHRDDLLRGDPLGLSETDAGVDVHALAGATADALRVAETAGELLAGWAFPAAPEFEAWLEVERRRAQVRVEAHLRDGAMHCLAAGETRTAVRLASRAVEANPLDEALQELLVRSLARHGDRPAAEEQAARCERLLRETLGVQAFRAIRAAVDDGPLLSRMPASAAASAALLVSGQAAIDAGATDAGIKTLRRAIELSGNDGQRASGLLRLGMALVHGLRGRDEEGAVFLHEAAQVSQRAGDMATSVAALRELAFVDIQAGRAATTTARLRIAAELAGDNDGLRCGVLAMQGMHLSDRGEQHHSVELLRASIEAAERSGLRRQAAWSRALLGRSFLLLGELGLAAPLFEESIEGCRKERWLAFLPFPLAMRAEAGMELEEASEALAGLLQEAFALGCELGDPCWEGLGGCGLARLSARRGELGLAWEQAMDALQRCTRHPDRYVWVEAWILVLLVELASRRGEEAEAKTARATLSALLARTEQSHLETRLPLSRLSGRA
jgi:DNA-binding SARP family transcriptional activator